MGHRSTALAGALLAGLAAPVGAHAVPVLSEPLEPCYATAGTAADPQREGVLVSATGFTPNAKVDLTLDGTPVRGGIGLQTDAGGTLKPLEVPAPFVRRGTRTFTLALVEQGNPANALSATAKSTALRVSVRPRTAAPSDRVRFSGSGFTERGAVFAHYVYFKRNPFEARRSAGKLVRTVRVRRPWGDCGRFRARRPQIPVDEPRLGYWLIQFDQQQRYAGSPKSASLVIRVFQR